MDERLGCTPCARCASCVPEAWHGVARGELELLSVRRTHIEPSTREPLSTAILQRSATPHPSALLPPAPCCSRAAGCADAGGTAERQGVCPLPSGANGLWPCGCVRVRLRVLRSQCPQCPQRPPPHTGTQTHEETDQRLLQHPSLPPSLFSRPSRFPRTRTRPPARHARPPGRLPATHTRAHTPAGRGGHLCGALVRLRPGPHLVPGAWPWLSCVRACVCASRSSLRNRCVAVRAHGKVPPPRCLVP